VGDRRRPAAVAVAARAPTRLWFGVGNKRPWEVLWVLGKLVEWLASGESERRRKFTDGGGNGGRGGSVARGGGEGRGLNRPAHLWVTAA
jgi:hypothetical protein